MFGRGYTGHEHLPEYGLIHMNARLYDPQAGRFLSPDPYVQDPADTQGYNRYAYALNNPLRYIDPSGELVYSSNDPSDWARLLLHLYMGGSVNDFDPTGWTLIDDYGTWGPDGFHSIISNNFDTFSGFADGGTETRLSSTEVELSELTVLSTHKEYFDQQMYANQPYYDVMDWLDRSDIALSIGGYAYDLLEMLSAPPKYWLGENGKYYKRSWGGNQHTGSRAGALKAARLYSVAGKTVFGVQAALSGVKVVVAFDNNDPNKWGVLGKSSLDIAMGAISIWGGPVGFGIGAIYFVGDSFDLWGDLGKTALNEY